MHDNELRLFIGQGIPTTVGTIFNVSNYDTVSGRDWNLLPLQRRADALRVEPRSRVIPLYQLDLAAVHKNLL